MTRQEQTGSRDLGFSQWVRKNLPDSSTGFVVSDLDFILYNDKNKTLLFLEVKTHGAKQRPWQASLFRLIDQMVSASASQFGIEYKGYHLLTLSSTTPEEGTILLDGQVITREELIFYLSFHGGH